MCFILWLKEYSLQVVKYSLNFETYLYQIFLLSDKQVMTAVTVTKKQIKQFCTPEIQIKEGINNDNGDPLYIKFIRINTIDKLQIQECLEFNRCVLGEPEVMVFPNHFLKIQEQIANKDLVGLVTQPYSTTLQNHVRGKTITEKDALIIFDQILKAIYSLYQQGYSTKNIRSQHFVLCNKIWKLESLVLDQRYEHGNGVSIEYLWSPKHQAPQCFKKSIYSEDDFDPMIVWNLGSILVEILLGNHKFSTLEIMEKFKGSAFAFQAIGLKQNITNKFSIQIKETLSYMLHFDPKKRTKLSQLFENKFLSPQVAKHYQANKKNVPTSKISMGRNSVRLSKIDSHAQNSLAEVNKTLEQRQLNKKKALEASRLSAVLDNDDFLDDLGQISTRIQPKQVGDFKKNKAKVPLQPQSMDEIMRCSDQDIRKALELYKSYFDQSELLILAIEVIQRLQFTNMTSKQVIELKQLIKYAIMFVSLINLNSLAQGFNQNRNILDLDGYIYTAFQSCSEYSSFQKVVNFKRDERAQILDNLRKQIKMNKDKPILANNPSLSKILELDFKKTSFQDIKTSYRFIVKYAYDTIAEQYNELKKTDMANKLAQTAMYVTYCLTIDKLYIKEHITDNFKYYFEWIKQPASNYVPLNTFKRYLAEAPKEVLIQNSRFILKKYYNI